MIAKFAGQDQRNWDEKWPEIMLAVNTRTSESTNHTPAFLTQGREPRLPSSLYDKETLGTGRATETPEENANKLREVFEIVRRNMEKESQDQARHYNLRWRQWSSAVGDIVWAKEHHLSKAAEGFAAKLAPRWTYPGCRFRHCSDLQNSPHTVEKRKDSSRWRAQATTKRADSRNVRCLTTDTRRQD